MTRLEVQGTVKPGFEKVAAAFAGNFEAGLEIGAAFAAYRGDEPLVDIWAGEADSRTHRPWRQDTIQTIFSGTKGMTGICMLMLLDRGLIALDEPVCSYWPEFGKPHVRIREIVSHQARLPGIATAEVSYEQMLDPLHMAELLAREPQSTDIRAIRTYHAVTIGWLCGEVLRRVTGRSVSQFFADEIAGLLGVEFWIGLPEPMEPRVAFLEINEGWAGNKLFAEMPGTDMKDDVLFWSAWWNPSHLSKTTFPVWNTRAFRAGQVPAANGVGTARAVARVYAEVAASGGRLMRPQTQRLASDALCDGWDGLLEFHRRNSIVFQLTTETRHLGPVARAFGHDGAGGSLHGCWPDQQIGFSYAMNLLRVDPEGDERGKRILFALAEATNAS